MSKTIVLGAEYDQTLFTTLKEVLRAEGAKLVDEQWGFTGSQEVNTWQV